MLIEVKAESNSKKEKIFLSQEKVKIEKGRNFIIPSGPFVGLEGKVINLLKNKIKLELPSLGVFLTLKTA